VAFFSPYLYRPNFTDIYPPSVRLFREWDGLLEWLVDKHSPADTQAATFPVGPLQMAAEDIEELGQ
jgi:hypothetical protein